MLNFLKFSYLRAFKISCSAELSMKKKLYNLGPLFVLSFCAARISVQEYIFYVL